MLKKYINTLDFYGYGESNKMESAVGKPYKVKVSDKDGNIITIEKDDSLYACVKLAFDADLGLLSLLDAAHDDSVLAEVEMPNADYIYNCRFDEELNAILFDVKSLYGNDTETIELDVESLVELYEAGQGIEIGEKNEETGRKPISVKLAEGDGLLTLTDDGLGIDDKVVTEDELEYALSGKADVEWVEEMLSGFSGVTEVIEMVEEHEEEIDKLKRIVGTDEETPSLFEQIEDNREDIAQIDDEVGELSGTVDTVLEDIESINESISSISGDIENITEKVDTETERAISAETNLNQLIDEETNRAINAESALSESISNEEEARKESAISSVNYDSQSKAINFLNANGEIIDSIDATDFIKDGMVDSVSIEIVDNTTYLVITWNTDAGKEVTRIDIGDLFEADNYYTKVEIDETVQGLRETDASLITTNDQQWAVINQNRLDMETVDNQLWSAINNEVSIRENADLELNSAIDVETNERTSADSELQSQINVEKEQRIAADDSLNNSILAENAARQAEDARIEELLNTKITEERNRAILAESQLSSDISAETQRASREESRIESKFDDDISELRQNYREIRQYVNDQDAIINHRIDGVVSDLEAEQNARQTKDLELANDIHDIRISYATLNYVDTRDEQVQQTAIQTSISSAKTYTDNEVDSLEVSMKQYCDDGHQELQNAIVENTTKINEITNDSSNGVLDVLHNEFHQLTDGITEQQMVGLLADMLRRIEALENN